MAGAGLVVFARRCCDEALDRDQSSRRCRRWARSRGTVARGDGGWRVRLRGVARAGMRRSSGSSWRWWWRSRPRWCHGWRDLLGWRRWPSCFVSRSCRCRGGGARWTGRSGTTRSFVRCASGAPTAVAISARSTGWLRAASKTVEVERPRTAVSSPRSCWWNVTSLAGISRAVTGSFYDRDWRRECRGGEYPESHLWSAAAAYLELDDAVGHLEH